MVTAYRPGVSVTSSAAPPPRGFAINTGTWFVVGNAEKGPVDRAVEIRNLNDYTRIFGARTVGAQTYGLYDALQTAFREGVVRAYVARVSGSSAVAASKTLLDASAGTSLKFTANSPGIWANSISIAVVAGVTAGTFIVVLTQGGVEIERSPELADQAAATNWTSQFGVLTIPGGASALDPAVLAATALTGGADDNAGITDSQRQAALALFTRDLGPGQVSIPGSTAAGNRTALQAHALAYNRFALLDPTDTGTKATLVTEATGLRGADKECSAIAGAPWVKTPGLVTNTKRIVPPSALAAGLIARSDSTKSPNEPAAGLNGLARYVIDLTQPSWSDLDRDELNSASVNVIRAYRNEIALYGARTLGDPNGQWTGVGNVRLRMKIVAEAELIAESFLFRQIDGKGYAVADFAGALRGLLGGFYRDGALFGPTEDEAFIVDTGDTVNTPTTLANNELRAIISVRMSPFAELVSIEIVKTAITEQI